MEDIFAKPDVPFCKECGVDTRQMGFVNRVPAGLNYMDCYICGPCSDMIDADLENETDCFDIWFETRCEEVDSDPEQQYAKAFRVLAMQDMDNSNLWGDEIKALQIAVNLLYSCHTTDLLWLAKHS